ncbi:MAG: HWE histidine kinase domain-containing protein [Devosia sp.]
MRSEAVEALKSLDAGKDRDFDRLVRLAAGVFDAPMALVALLDGDKLLFFARYGVALDGAPARHTLVEATISSVDLPYLTISDAAADPGFAHEPLVAGPTRVRFYAGAPISVRGQKVGALCVLSPEPCERVEQYRLAELEDLAGLAGSLFELKGEAQVRARVSADLMREEWRHALTLEAGKVGSWVWDLRSGEIVSNDIFRRMLGLSTAKTLDANDLMAAIAPADVAAVNKALDMTFEEGADYAVEFRIASTGRWLIGRGRVYQRDGAGKPLVMMGVNIDVTEAREAADQTRLLLRELNHRVKNTLAMIQSLARQTLRQKPDPQAFIDSFSGRLRTLSDAHTLLADRDWSGIGLVELMQSQVAPYLIHSPDQLVISGDDLRLPPDHALGLGLVLHELSSNAVKFGALSSAAGKVNVSWTVKTDIAPQLELLWKESGGPTVVPPTETGFGTRLIERSLDKVLGSDVALTYPAEGAEARITLPLD